VRLAPDWIWGDCEGRGSNGGAEIVTTKHGPGSFGCCSDTGFRRELFKIAAKSWTKQIFPIFENMVDLDSWVGSRRDAPGRIQTQRNGLMAHLQFYDNRGVLVVDPYA